MFFQTPTMSKCFMPNCVPPSDSYLYLSLSFLLQRPSSKLTPGSNYRSNIILPNRMLPSRISKFLPCVSVSKNDESKPDPESSINPDVNPTSRNHNKKTKVSKKGDEHSNRVFPETIPRKPRRGRRSESVAVEDYIRNSLEMTFASIRQRNSDVLENKENVLKETVDDNVSDIDDDDDDEDEDDDDVEEEEGSKNVATRRKKKMVVEDEDPNWPVDADVGWGTRASEYFEQHPIKNVTGEDGVEIDWEGEVEDNWVKEINCLEWESFAFHPSPLIVLVFERYNRATDNWKALKELEKALQVYWNAKDRLPPRSVKIDINIERDLAYALKVKGCPQILFLKGNRMLYREKEIRTADELVNMIAFFYYNAKKPVWIDDAALARPF